jgi:hypothetical protein
VKLGGGAFTKIFYPYLGNFLGDMAKEMVGRIILRVAVVGPKNYIEEHSAEDGTDIKYNIKIRSFHMSAEAEQKLTFDRMLRLILRKFGPNRSVLFINFNGK